VSGTATTLFDADTSLLTPLDGPPLDFASCTSYDCTAASGSNAPPSSPSPEDTNPPPSHLSRPTSNTITLDNDTEPSHPALEAASAGVKALSLDEGEKDGNGQVMLADCQPCEQCGGKVVWATKGEWLLICEGCQEPQ
jgi:hypothetical protein